MATLNIDGAVGVVFGVVGCGVVVGVVVVNVVVGVNVVVIVSGCAFWVFWGGRCVGVLRFVLVDCTPGLIQPTQPPPFPSLFFTRDARCRVLCQR